ncbi:MAG TPA: apolipoprotein N-acyltransferase [Spirochaetia bacterium]|nr:apolipoprotein N-acyltransferase [Spirochaetia bacterium]
MRVARQLAFRVPIPASRTAPLPRWPLVLIVLSSSILLPLSLPSEFFGAAIRALGLKPDESFYWGNAMLGFVAIAPVFYAVSRAPTFGFASILGLIFGGISTALSNYWLMFFQGYSTWTMGGTVLGYMGVNSLLFPFLRGFSRVSTRYRPFLFALAWCGYEYLKSVGFVGYPWGLIAYPIGSFLPLIQFVDVTGIWGLSFLMALVNALVAEAALWGHGHAGGRLLLARQAAFGVFLVACVLVYGVIRLATPIPHDTSASLLLVQQNSNPWQQGGGANAASFTANQELTLQGLAATRPVPDLAVWSESSVTDVWVDASNRFSPPNNKLEPFFPKAGIPILFGGIYVKDYEKRQYMNAAILVSPDGRVVDTYGKMHPVPFAESIPFFEYEPVQKFFRDVVGVWNPWFMGNRYTIFSVPLRAGGTLRFGVPICFEDAFSDLDRGFVIRGADMLVNITNDSWSNTWSSEIQHFTVARFRAIENRRVLVRSTNGGVSGVVGPWGETWGRMPFFQAAWRAVEVPIYKEKTFTPYTRFGDWFPRLVLALLFVVLVVNVLVVNVRPKKRGYPAPAA